MTSVQLSPGERISTIRSGATSRKMLGALQRIPLMRDIEDICGTHCVGVAANIDANFPGPHLSQVLLPHVGLKFAATFASMAPCASPVGVMGTILPLISSHGPMSQMAASSSPVKSLFSDAPIRLVTGVRLLRQRYPKDGLFICGCQGKSRRKVKHRVRPTSPDLIFANDTPTPHQRLAPLLSSPAIQKHCRVEDGYSVAGPGGVVTGVARVSVTGTRILPGFRLPLRGMRDCDDWAPVLR